ncbi:uncharacterized protein DUF664 [Haloactinospora alba]|uniref:Uncharacterized protein DUF664 n=1 Tax=Haloactinospora alba TaxID=405555 RepID=A0A543NK51_9ACTN|nr:DUF664 domain-containing protein [Haloactinospora alba]TQN32198.1 uncharacterized protein DUF664 [Haloactinospora alba]
MPQTSPEHDAVGAADTDDAGSRQNEDTAMEEFLYFVDRALAGMVEIARQLGDDLVNRRPALKGANSAFGLTTHCLGVVDYWVGALAAGRVVHRDREAEFHATGTVAELVSRVQESQRQLRLDLEHVAPSAPARGDPPSGFLGPQRALTQGGVLLHVLEELSQHHGQLEVLRDLLTAHSQGTPHSFGPEATR